MIGRKVIDYKDLSKKSDKDKHNEKTFGDDTDPKYIGPEHGMLYTDTHLKLEVLKNRKFLLNS